MHNYQNETGLQVMFNLESFSKFNTLSNLGHSFLSSLSCCGNFGLLMTVQFGLPSYKHLLCCLCEQIKPEIIDICLMIPFCKRHFNADRKQWKKGERKNSHCEQKLHLKKKQLMPNDKKEWSEKFGSLFKQSRQ